LIEFTAIAVLIGILSIFAVLYLGIIFKLLDRVVPRPRPKAAIDIEAESIEEEISREAQHRAQMIEKLIRYSTQNPEKIALLIKTWLEKNGGLSSA